MGSMDVLGTCPGYDAQQDLANVVVHEMFTRAWIEPNHSDCEVVNDGLATSLLIPFHTISGRNKVLPRSSIHPVGESKQETY